MTVGRPLLFPPSENSPTRLANWMTGRESLVMMRKFHAEIMPWHLVVEQTRNATASSEAANIHLVLVNAEDRLESPSHSLR